MVLHQAHAVFMERNDLLELCYFGAKVLNQLLALANLAAQQRQLLQGFLFFCSGAIQALLVALEVAQQLLSALPQISRVTRLSCQYQPKYQKQS